MFLFTTPTGTPAGSSSGAPVVDAIRQAADQTGTSFEYLLSTAKRESALDPQAKAGTSSATGLFQFIEQTWLGLVKSEGPKLGLSDLADAITARPEGGYGVGNGAARDAILKLREDPRLSAMMAGALTQQNRSALSAATGREPSSGELYMAHVLGARGATDVIRAANDNPDRPVASDMPDAASANRSIFYDRQGRARGAGEVYAVLGAALPASRPAPATSTGQGDAGRNVVRQSGPALQGLFTTGGRVGPISDAVAKLWHVNNTRVDPKQTAASYFPRDDAAASEAAAADAPAASPATAAPAPAPAPVEPARTAQPGADLPLPPPRPKAAAQAGAPGGGANVKRSGRRS